jgi:hypothetical protein
MEEIMRKSAVAIVAIGLLSVATTLAPQAAEAHDWDHRGWRHEDRGHNAGPAIAFGVIGGILTGAAIASAQSHAAYSYQPYYTAPYGYAGYGYYR